MQRIMQQQETLLPALTSASMRMANQVAAELRSEMLQ